MTVTPQQVQKLREMTGAGILDCKKALEQTGGDNDKAIQFLREKGKASAASKAGRAAGQGVVCVWTSADSKKAGLVEINCETDFVARTAEFQQLAKTLSQQVGEGAIANAETLKSQKLAGTSETVESVLKEKIGKLGENMLLRKAASLGGASSFIGSYVHAPFENAPQCGTLGVLVEVESGKDGAELRELLKELAMQVAAANPKWVRKEEVPAEIVAREKAIYLEQCKQSGKPEQAWEKILAGKLADFYRQFCLLDQSYVRDASGKTAVGSLVEAASQKSGGALSVKKFVRIKLGEE
jgi:elongation factor Ts